MLINPKDVVNQLRTILADQLPVLSTKERERVIFIPKCREVSVDHLHQMLDQIESGQVTGEKAQRWLGWIQGVLVARGIGTFEQMRTMNAEAGAFSDITTPDWVIMAYAKLGVVRDKMPPEAVEIVQDFLGPVGKQETE